MLVDPSFAHLIRPLQERQRDRQARGIYAWRIPLRRLSRKSLVRMATKRLACVLQKYVSHRIVKRSPTTVALPPTSDSKTPFGGLGWQNGPGHKFTFSLKPYGSVIWSISVTSYVPPCDRNTTGRIRPSR